MGWIDVVGGHQLDIYGEKVGCHRKFGEPDCEYRIRLRQEGRPSDDGGSAFPEPGMAQCGGMSLRDYFAAKAMPLAWKAAEDGYFESGEDSINQDVAACAYQMADAMLAERAK